MAKPYAGMSQENLRAVLADLILQRGESLSEFGAILARTIDEKRAPFSRQYVYRLKKGQDVITEEIATAVLVLGAMIDGVSELQARAHPVRVLAVHDLPEDVVVMGKHRGCGLAGCRIQFVPASPNQRYCSRDCRAEAARRRQVSVKGDVQCQNG